MLESKESNRTVDLRANQIIVVFSQQDLGFVQRLQIRLLNLLKAKVIMSKSQTKDRNKSIARKEKLGEDQCSTYPGKRMPIR